MEELGRDKNGEDFGILRPLEPKGVQKNGTIWSHDFEMALNG